MTASAISALPTALSGPRDPVDATTAAELLGLPLSSFNAARRAMQLVWDRATDRLLPYPDHRRDERGNVLTAAEQARRQREFDATHILVVPEWGGIKYPGTSWNYSRSRCVCAGPN